MRSLLPACRIGLSFQQVALGQAGSVLYWMRVTGISGEAVNLGVRGEGRAPFPSPGSTQSSPPSPSRVTSDSLVGGC